MQRKILLSSCLVCAALLVLAGCTKKQTKKQTERQIRVTLSPLVKRVFRQQIPVQGTVCPVEYATLSAKISGTLELLKADEGDVKKKGDVLFGIDQQILKNRVTVCENEIKVKAAELESAKIALKSSEISKRKAKLDYDRFMQLWESKATSKAELEVYETVFQKAEMDVRSANAAVVNAAAKLKQAESDLTIAKKNLDDSVIRAPFDCIITDKYIEENEFVSAGKNILKLENHNELEVICYISAVYYDQISADITAAEIMVDNKVMGRAKVTYKAPSIDPESRTFKLKISIPPELKLVSGTLCDLNLILTEKESIGLPTESLLLRAGDRYIVYACNADNRAKSYEVKRGIIDGKFCEILNHKELTGMKFIVTGQTFVNNNTPLQIINAD